MEMATIAKHWTIEEMYALPEDGLKYEVVRGELFVSPAPTRRHEDVCARLSLILSRYVDQEQLGLVYHPRAVLRFEGSEVEPDLMVRDEDTSDNEDWALAPTPLLIVEVFSPSTKNRDKKQKRDLYMDAGVAEYWMVDPHENEITVIRKGQPNLTLKHEMTWQPNGAAQPLAFAMEKLFG